ncbi:MULTISPECIES: cation diffusion facilitator family transporter [Halobacteriovorax]|uniref:cation diffusion facilitator family transporter n=1 Tax=Halobacteriovorax TaxID=1652133 RepID=UPI000EB721EF|nr:MULTISPECIES: cation diffusion facilitator family transporter [Halobacteriovorax]AYF44733.1 cation diffusion facilitator family transporter [Halobacteriovorax sp. BALOs_7]
MKTELLSRESAIKKVLLITFFLNIAVALIKLFAGIQFDFLSLRSSGIESLFDGSSNILGLITIAIAAKPSDRRHNYGHYKFENLGALIIALMLFGSSIKLGIDYHDFVFSGEQTRGLFGAIPILSILISIAVSAFVSSYEGRKGRELNSKILIADSGHTFGDMVISIGVLISIVCAKFEIFIVDYIVGGLIIFYLFYLAIQITLDNLNDLLDVSPVIKDRYLKALEDMQYVRDIHEFRARGNTTWMQIDFHLLLDPKLSLTKAHEISHEVEDRLRSLLKDYCRDIDILIHIEPDDETHED